MSWNLPPSAAKVVPVKGRSHAPHFSRKRWAWHELHTIRSVVVFRPLEETDSWFVVFPDAGTTTNRSVGRLHSLHFKQCRWYASVRLPGASRYLPSMHSPHPRQRKVSCGARVASAGSRWPVWVFPTDPGVRARSGGGDTKGRPWGGPDPNDDPPVRREDELSIAGGGGPPGERRTEATRRISLHLIEDEIKRQSSLSRNLFGTRGRVSRALALKRPGCDAPVLLQRLMQSVYPLKHVWGGLGTTLCVGLGGNNWRGTVCPYDRCDAETGCPNDALAETVCPNDCAAPGNKNALAAVRKNGTTTDPNKPAVRVVSCGGLGPSPRPEFRLTGCPYQVLFVNADRAARSVVCCASVPAVPNEVDTVCPYDVLSRCVTPGR